jgi:anti-sigma B factor antagonist
MLTTDLSIVPRTISKEIRAIDIKGEVTRFAENKLMEVYTSMSGGEVRVILLNFKEMTYMNSSGIGLIITLLIRANRTNQTLVGVGLSEHMLRIFELTRLHEAIRQYATEEEALAAVTGKGKE